MNYNEYDSNGNKKRFDFSDIINDKTQRSRFLLFVYLIIFIVLVIFIRANISNTNVNKEKQEQELKEEETNNQNSVVENSNTELDEMFSFIDLNNYDFVFNINIKDSNSIITGKRYNSKYDFELKNNDYILYFNGTSNYIKAKESIDGESKLTGFPYALINIFDTNVLKSLIANSNLNNNIYEITNEEIGKVAKETISNGELINTIELVKSNNKVVQINLNIANAMSSYMKEEVNATIALKYSNFGLVDDFKIE